LSKSVGREICQWLAVLRAIEEIEGHAAELNLSDLLDRNALGQRQIGLPKVRPAPDISRSIAIP
jgi:hypothetical protein